jgi:hypothetical protein
MPKTTTIDHTSVLEMALVGYEVQRNRIESAMNEIRAELGQGGPSRSISTATDNSEPKATGKKRFSAAARKRMAAAQRKRWNELKAMKEAKKAKPTAAPKRQKAAVPARKLPVHVKAGKKVARKVVKAAPAIQKAVAKPKVEEPALRVQAAVEPAPTEATA